MKGLTMKHTLNSGLKTHSNLSMFCLFALVVVVSMTVSPDAMASSTSGAALPWEGPLAKLQASITGPVAFFASIVGLVGSMVALIWGGDMNGILRSLMVLVLIISVLVAAQNFLSVLFGVGAEIAVVAQTAMVGIV